MAAPGAAPLRVLLAGPIGWWWGPGRWDSPEHVGYVAWRQAVHDALVAAGHLVYRPDTAWKGAWQPVAQAVNDTALVVCDVVVVLTPPGVASAGTDDELVTAARASKPVVPLPPDPADDALARAVDAVQRAGADAPRLPRPQEVLVDVALLQRAVGLLEDPEHPLDERAALGLALRTVLREDRPVPGAAVTQVAVADAPCPSCRTGVLRRAGLHLLCDRCGQRADLSG